MSYNWVHQNPVTGEWKDGYTGRTIHSSPPSGFAGEGKEWTYTESCGWQPVPAKTSSPSSGGGCYLPTHSKDRALEPLCLLAPIVFFLCLAVFSWIFLIPVYILSIVMVILLAFRL